MTRLTTILLAAFLALTLTACSGGAEETPVTRQIIAMDTAMSFSLYGENGDEAVQAMVEEVQRLEGILSRTDSFSEIGFLNRMPGQSVEVGEEVTALLERARTFTETTGGAFDITIAPVVEAWGFTTDSYQVPEAAVLTELLGTMGMEHVHVDGATAMLDTGTQVDLGGIAKGYASDKVAELLREKGVEKAILTLGGNVYGIGTKPDGEKWEVALANPLDANDYCGLISIEDQAVVTSGGYQRYFEENGKKYHHIIDPATGYPAESGLLSVTIISESGMEADVLSTALFVMGLEDALEYWQKNGGFEAIFITEAGEVIATEGADACFAFEGRDNDFTYRMVEKE